jgi:nucleotide-binding universal stress UspA family protein
MLRSILIGLDGSGYSTAALELGLRRAGQFEATLVGLGIIDVTS